jgi:hypothetical protein
MSCHHRSQLRFTIIDKIHSAVARNKEVLRGIVQRSEPSIGLCNVGRFEFSASVHTSLSDQSFPAPVHNSSFGHRGGCDQAKHVFLGNRDVFHAFENGPSPGIRSSLSSFFRNSTYRLDQCCTATLETSNDFALLIDFHSKKLGQQIVDRNDAVWQE